MPLNPSEISAPPSKPCIYISGPMSGYEDWNFKAFNEAAIKLRSAGYPTINPADFGANPNDTWESCLKRDIAVLVHCETVVTLDGWEKSRGASLEVYVAKALGIPVVSISDLLLDAAAS